MCQLVETVSRFRLGILMWCLVASPLMAQNSNRLWFAVNNGTPTPSADVAVQSLGTDGSATFLAAAAAAPFVVQTNLTILNSPYDVAIDPAMGKVFVLDNNVSGTTNEFIYSFNLSGTPSQIAASKEIIYAMPPVPAADVSARYFPFLSGMALDVSRHLLYFNQIDVITGTNSYLGRIDLTTSATSDLHSTGGGKPVVQFLHVGQIPGVGPIALDNTNVYIGAINARLGNAGIYTAPRDSNTAFTRLVALSTGNVQFTNGFPGGVACDPASHSLYYLTFNAGILNQNYDLQQNAVWVYDLATHSSQRIGSGYSGYPDNLAVDPANRRFYFTIGRDGTGNAISTNYQAVYVGNIGALTAPTLLYQPALHGQDINGQINAGNVALQGIFVEDPPELNSVAAVAGYTIQGAPAALSPALMVTDYGSTVLSNAQVKILSGQVAGDTLTALTSGTAITANYDSQMEVLSLTGYDSPANYQLVLRSVAFSSTNVNPTLNQTLTQRTISWSVSDGGLNSATVTTLLDLATVNADLLNQISISMMTNGWSLQYYGAAKQKYVVQKSSIITGSWSDLSGVLTSDGSGLVSFVDTNPPLPAVRYYRVRTWP